MKCALFSLIILLLTYINAQGSFLKKACDYAQSNASWKQDCELQTKYEALSLSASRYGISLEQITFYQALRYVEIYAFDRAEEKEIPVSKIYTLKRSQLEGPVELRPTTIWDNWVAGIAQLETLVLRIQNGLPLTLSDLKSLHAGFYTKGDEAGDFSHNPHPGVLKPGFKNDNAWWTVDNSEWVSTAQNIRSIHDKYASMGLIPAEKPQLPGLNYILGFREGGIYAADTKYLSLHMNLFVQAFNEGLQSVRQSGRLIVGGQEMTAFQFANFIQQYFVRLHPFYEGNGRMSRFLQDLVLSVFGLPAGGSGYLMRTDVLTLAPEYNQQALNAVNSVFEHVEKCLSNEYPILVKKNRAQDKDLKSLSRKEFSYRCRLL